MHSRISHRILFATILFSLVSFASKGTDDVRILNKMPTDSLIDRGQKDVNNGNFEDALVCFTVAAKRYEPDLDKEEKRRTMVANVGKWYVYFFQYYDHVNAFKALSAAQEISREIGENNSRIYLNYGCMYQTLAEQSDDSGLLEKAFGYYKKAIIIGLKNDTDLSSVNMAFSNLVQISATLDKIDQLNVYREKVLKRNAELKVNSPTLSFNNIFYDVILKMRAKDYSGAIKELDGEKIRNIVRQEGMGRFDVVRLINLAKAHIGLDGNYPKAIEYLQRAELTADSVAMKDARLEVYKNMRDVYEDSGLKDKAMEYQYKYLALKDSVLNYRSGAAIGELTYLKKIENVEKSLDSIQKKKEMLTDIVWLAIALIAIAATSLWLLRRHNIRLRTLNETLYKNNLLLIEKEETTRNKLEEAVRQKSLSENDSERKTARYHRSDLTDEEKEDIYLSVMNVLLNSHEVFESDFSSARLAELTGYTYRHISQVINEKTGDNFNALVNDTRVKEACRNMQPGGKFSNLTIEAIANSVGFRSRTSFIAAFKKFTGMTPSGYQKIAAEKSKKRHTDIQ